MLDKLKAIVTKKEYLDRQFEKPVEIKLSAPEAVSKLLKLGVEQRQLEVTRKNCG